MSPFFPAKTEWFYFVAQIQLLKPSSKAVKLIDLSAAADDEKAAAVAAALTNAAAAAAGMSKELLDTLPLEEVKKRTVLQAQVCTCIKSHHRLPLLLPPLTSSAAPQELGRLYKKRTN
jgi:hypothetical protein